MTAASEPTLSICIPTYNFGHTIAATLDSIAAQDGPEVEIVILDSASSDDTATIVEAFASRYGAVRYVRSDRRGGIDRDMARVVELATTDYVWLFSADDLMRPGALAYILDLIARDRSDVLLVSHSNCDYAMQVLTPRYPVLRGGSRQVRIAGPSDREAYFAAALTTEAVFSFMSGLVVCRQTWQGSGDENGDELFIGSCWSHAARLLRAMKHGAFSITYVHDVLVDRRGDNDSFAKHGVVRRYAIAIEGYAKIAATLFGDRSPELANVRRVLRREFGLNMILHAKRRCLTDPMREDLVHLNVMVSSLYTGSAVRDRLTLLGYRFLPPSLTTRVIGTWRRILHAIQRPA